MPKINKANNIEATQSRLTRSIGALQELWGIFVPVPPAWFNGATRASKNGKPQAGRELECIPCESYEELQEAWQEAFEWTDGLDHALVSMLASIASVRCVGDQIWLKILGPAGCGKSTLCEAINVAKEYIVSKDTFTGLSSGYQVDDSGEENLSLVSKINDKTLIINDGDTLLQLPNLPQVISQLRAFYGGNLRTDYKNKMSHNHEGYNTTILLCGTSSLRKLDQSELGQRFLDVVIMEKIDSDLEDKILWRKANQADREMAMEADGNSASRYDPAMANAMQLTGGYVNYLRGNANELMSQVKTTNRAKRLCMRLGKFVAMMRARPSYLQEETAEREFAARLVSQLVRYAKSCAVVLNEKVTNPEVMRRTTKVAIDSGRGQTMEIAKVLFNAGENGLGITPISLRTMKTDTKTETLLRFLTRIEVTKRFNAQTVTGLSPKLRWKLTGGMHSLYEEILGE